ncbi:MAG: hypothetical protein ABJE66_17320 [Deltaproteobacteria bacterium]
MSTLSTLSTLSLDDLALVNGGDGWDDYKNRIRQDASDTAARARQAIHYNAVNGHWDAGRFFDNVGGTFYNGAKTAIDAIPVLGPAITNRL